ncbi:MAG TPA: integrase core domain-containing protein, partial [Dehalococcoidia bacterium]|nr:integrase core domain-containing protein [Dehalococcoidia bacterium]
MHRTLKAETTRPAAGSLAAQQRRFNDFRDEFNQERPHEALDQQTPASCYVPSTRAMPATLPPLVYPDRFEVRYVSANGGIRWNRRFVTIAEAGLRRRLPVCGLAIACPHKNGVLPREAAAAQLALRLVVPLEPFDIRCNPPTVRTAVSLWNAPASFSLPRSHHP